MERFGYKKTFDELNGSGIHRLENILTLDLNVYHLFDTLRLWLEPIESVSKFHLQVDVNWNFNWVFRIHPTPTNSVRLEIGRAHV